MSEQIEPAADAVASEPAPPPEPKPAKLVGPDNEDASGLVPKDWSGPAIVVDLETCYEVQGGKALHKLGVKPIPVLGVHKRKPFLTPEDQAAGRIKRAKSFAILGCTQRELSAKQKEIAKAKAEALKKGGL